MRLANGNPKREDRRSAGAIGLETRRLETAAPQANQPGISLNKMVELPGSIAGESEKSGKKAISAERGVDSVTLQTRATLPKVTSLQK